MKSQFPLHSAPASSSLPASQAKNRVAITALLCLLLTASCSNLLAQENFLVATQDGTFSLYDLTSFTLLESFQSAPYTYTLAAGPNPRLAYSAGGAGWGVPVDTTIGHDIVRFTDVIGSSSAIGHAGKYFLVSNYHDTLDIVDTATLTKVRTVDLSSVNPRVGLPGGIASANDQAYVLPRGQSAGGIAVVNLSNFQLSSIPFPAGTFCRRCVARTPDGSLVVVLEFESSDSKTHVLLINSTTNQIIGDFPQTKNYGVASVVVTPSGSGPLYGYVFSNASGSLLTLDLRPNSQTYGQILDNTAVPIPNISLADMAINSDGSRVIFSGVPVVQPPAPNVAVVDTVNHVVTKLLTVSGGIPANATCTGFFPTTPPNTAPTVSGVSGDITNDKNNDVTITGTNFQAGALVRIGSLPPLPANVMGSTTLSVTVPAGVPAGQAQNIIVTNPLTNMPPNQQNQSGLLAGKFSILPNPRFQPNTQFASVDDGVVYLYDLKQQSLVNVFNSPSDYINGLVFNQDGKYLYFLAQQYYTAIYYVQSIDLSTNTAGNPILLPSEANGNGPVHPLVAARDPQKNTPVIYVGWVDTDLHISKIDSDPSSPTFNTIVQTFNAGLSSNPFLEAVTVSPDNKFAYAWYNDSSSSLGIFNLSTGAFTSISAAALGIDSNHFQEQVYVTPDGKFLLLSDLEGARTSIKVFDISNPISPENIATITPQPIRRQGFSSINNYPAIDNYQVIGNKLYAIDLSGTVVVFNFIPDNRDFRERGFAASDQPQTYDDFAFSADGAYLYLPNFFLDSVLIVDARKLETSANPTLTNIRAPYTPYLLAVNPVPPSGKAATAKKSGDPQQ